MAYISHFRLLILWQLMASYSMASNFLVPTTYLTSGLQLLTSWHHTSDFPLFTLLNFTFCFKLLQSFFDFYFMASWTSNFLIKYFLYLDLLQLTSMHLSSDYLTSYFQDLLLLTAHFLFQDFLPKICSKPNDCQRWI